MAKKRKPAKKTKKKAVKKAKKAKKRAKPVSRKKPAKRKPAKKAIMKRPVRRKPVAKRRPVKKTIKKPVRRKLKKKPFIRVKLPKPKKTTKRQIVAKQKKVMHRAARLAVEDIAKLTSFDLTERELDRLSKDVERMIKAFESLEKLIVKKKRR